MSEEEGEEEEDVETAIVIANGTINTYFGFAGEVEPEIFVPSIKCHDEYMETTNDINNVDEIQLNINAQNIYNYNEIQSVDDIEKILRSGHKQLLTNHNRQNNIAEEEYNGFEVVLSTMNGTNKKTRIRTAQIIFEKMGGEGLYDANASVLSLYASGRMDGMVLDSGHHKTFATAVFGGNALSYTTKSLGLGGLHVTNYLKCLIDKRHSNNNISLIDIHRIKEQCCYVKDKTKQQATCKTYVLPDGTLLQNELFLCSEILFNPQLINFTEDDNIYNSQKQLFSHILNYYIRNNIKNRYDQMIGLLHSDNNAGCFNIINDYYNGPLSSHKFGVIDLIRQCVDESEYDIHKTLMGNIILQNGNTMFDGFAQRIERELKQIITKYQVKVIHPAERRTSSWIGGSIIGSLTHCFSDPFCRKHDWIENGESAFLRKCI